MAPVRRRLVGRRRQDVAGRLRQRLRPAGALAARGAVPVPRWVPEGGGEKGKGGSPAARPRPPS